MFVCVNKICSQYYIQCQSKFLPYFLNTPHSLWIRIFWNEIIIIIIIIHFVCISMLSQQPWGSQKKEHNIQTQIAKDNKQDTHETNTQQKILK